MGRRNAQRHPAALRHGVRLNQYLAACGVASRRGADALISSGNVEIDGEIVTALGVRVTEEQDIRVDGVRIRPRKKCYLALYKPRGYTCTRRDAFGRKTVFDLIPGRFGRVFPVGRLDRDSEGLLLFTNDGDFANRVSHPRYTIPKTYLVEVAGLLDQACLDKLRKGVWLSCGKVAFDHVAIAETRGRHTALTIVIHEGMNRAIRRALAKVGLKVRRLKRTGIGRLRLRHLKAGDMYEMQEEECKSFVFHQTGD